MKITGLMLFVSVASVIAAETYAQTTKLNLHVENARIAEVLLQIERNSEFRFFYNEKVDLNEKVSIKARDKTVFDILAQILDGTGIQYKVMGKQIALFHEHNPFSWISQQQQHTVSGKVTDSDGQPLPGVSIVIKGTTQGSVTNSDGNYTLTNLPADAVLIYSFVGMHTEEVIVERQTTINVVMDEETIGLEEVVTIGYGTQKKVNLTGAISTVSSEQLENKPIVSIGHGLQGVLPNLNIKYDTGSPTESADFNIRGFESITGGDPLILVDGIPMNIERLNPNDIAKITVLKDASSAAVYGARAAFGVILVETKKGKKDELSVRLSTEQAMTKPIFFIEPINDPYLFVTTFNKGWERQNGVPYFDEKYLEGTKRWSENPSDENAWEVIDGVIRFYGNNDYINKVLTNYAPQQKYDLVVSGASGFLSSYYVSFGFLNKDGYLKINNENYKRYNILVKAEVQIADWISLDEKISFNSQVNDRPHYLLDMRLDININSLSRMSPIIPLEFPDLPYYIEPGDRQEFEQYIGIDCQRLNIIPFLEQGSRETWTTNDTWLSQGLTITPFEDFRIKSDFSYRTYWRDYQDVANHVELIPTQPVFGEIPLNPIIVSYGQSEITWIENQFNRSQYYVFNTYAEYEMQRYTDHYLKGMIGFNQEWGRNNMISAKAQDLVYSQIHDLNATVGTQETDGSKDHNALRGIFYRVNYIYKDKYLLEVNGRYDGTSRFPKNSRFGFFPSGAIGWRISNESFLKKADNWLDNLKLRASYGELGNQMVGSYPYISTMGSDMAAYLMSSGGQKIPTVSPPGLVSSKLTWETVTTKNFGFDINMFNQRLATTFDIYNRTTKNMLMSVEYPDILGTSSPKENAANLKTNGWELSVTWWDRIKQNWQYGLNLSISDNKSEITRYENPTGKFSDYYVGKTIGEIWGFETVGIFQNEEDVLAAPDQSEIGSNWRAGDIQYKDLNNDGKITKGNLTIDNPGDLTIIGNSSPRYSFGINPYMSYKNWSINVFFQGLFRDFWPDTHNHRGFWPGNAQSIFNFHVTETWSEDNRNAYFPAYERIWNDKVQKNIQIQTRYLQNAAYIRLKNLTLSYTIPTNWVDELKIKHAEVYFSGMNLWEYTKMHKPFDPEQRDDLYQDYYFQRIFTLGAKITF